MRYKVFVGTGFAMGFLAGAWAGRDGYDRVMRRVRGIKDHPSVHATAGVLQAQAAGAVGSAKRAVAGTVPGSMAARNGPATGARTAAGYESGNGTRPDASSQAR